MFVAWQQDPIRGRGGGPAPLDDPDLCRAGYAEPWRGLRCVHHGTGRTAWTPFVVEDERQDDGRLAQRLLFRLPAIRSCCIDDEFARAAWWHDAEWALRVWADAADPILAAALLRDRPDLVAGLRDVIRKPSPIGLRAFAAFRADREAEDRARDAANRLYWSARVRELDAHALVAEEERPADCFAVLGLHPHATLGQIKARHRALAKQHHPDRGGAEGQFRAIQDAYERAMADRLRRDRE